MGFKHEVNPTQFYLYLNQRLVKIKNILLDNFSIFDYIYQVFRRFRSKNN